MFLGEKHLFERVGCRAEFFERLRYIVRPNETLVSLQCADSM